MMQFRCVHQLEPLLLRPLWPAQRKASQPEAPSYKGLDPELPELPQPPSYRDLEPELSQLAGNSVLQCIQLEDTRGNCPEICQSTHLDMRS